MVSVKYTLTLIAVIPLFAGMPVIAANNTDSPTAPISRGEKHDLINIQKEPLFPDSGKFFASLRFWEKKQSQPSPHQNHKPHTATGGTPARPQEVATAKNNISSKQSSPPMPRPSAATGMAPEPPPNPYFIRENMESGNAPLPVGRAAALVYDSSDDNAPTPQGVLPTKISHSPSAYSYDTRDWVDLFPYQQEQAPVPVNVLASTQPTSLHLPTKELLQTQSVSEDDQWNGQATTLVAHVQRAPVPHTPGPTSEKSVSSPPIILPGAAPVENPLETIPAAKFHGNLSPSYEKRLPYVQTCGVVVVQANFPLTEIASILDEIEQLQHDLEHYIGVPVPTEKIELCLFKNEETYINFLRDVFPKAPRDRRALYVKLDDKPGTLMVQKSKDFEIDLRHEMTHAVIHASIPRVPIWLDEGLAKYFEVPIKDRASSHPYMKDVRWQANLGVVPSLDRLAKLETIDDMGAKEYRDAWAWTHFLIHRSPETHRLLAAYLQMLANWTGTEGKSTNSANVITLPGGKTLDLSVARGREKQIPAPSLKLYLDDTLDNQRGSFKEHFCSTKNYK